ncbi:MBOAT family O-acyltransferase [Winogradskyella sp. R77965]|uniref:MBOAT family O-acyltransferase n=1 Tax=Winogradskyella sp. R77965 TaxID=3093872 RepID=UPI0037DCCB87
MLFNSIDFAIFLPLVFALYWLLRDKLFLQNSLIAVSSYVFYGWWDWRFLFLIMCSTIVDYLIGRELDKSKVPFQRKVLLFISIGVNLGLLGFFKYYNFFLDNFVDVFQFFGRDLNFRGLEIVLPVGISFYTFQTLSYTIDIYRRKLEPTSNFIAFTAFVSFFPQLVAGPIERATHLLPQFYTKRKFNYTMAVDGLRQILWGLFKKVVIADNCAKFANEIFNNSDSFSGSTLFLGAFFFAFQIYGDFSGYSDIAIGTSRLFGFDLMKNFAFPYFSRNVAEFWRRWHISLSTWFRDYLYIPLGGSRGSSLQKVRNIFIIFIVSGFWHGANWTFIIWGALNALYFLPLLLRNKNRIYTDTIAEDKVLPSIRELTQVFLTFLLTVIAWVFFRAENLSHAFSFFNGMFSKTFFTIPEIRPTNLLILISLFMIVEWFGRTEAFALSNIDKKMPRIVRYILYYTILLCLLYFAGAPQEFIYFQF